MNQKEKKQFSTKIWQKKFTINKSFKCEGDDDFHMAKKQDRLNNFFFQTLKNIQMRRLNQSIILLWD